MVKNEVKLLIYSLLLGCVFTLLFYGKEVGISFPIFIIVLFLISLKILRENTGAIKRHAAYLLLFPIVLLSLNFFTNSNDILAFFNLNMVMLLLIVTALLITGKFNGKWYSLSFLGHIIAETFIPIRYFIRPAQIFANKVFKFKEYKRFHTVQKVLLGLIITFPILVIVIALLSSADVVFNSSISSVARYLENLVNNAQLKDILNITLLIFLVSIYYFSFCTNIFYRPEIKKDKHEITSVYKPLDSTVLITMLSVLDIIYILFSVIQFSYLFSGGGRELPGGLTYAEYARQGFFQLLVAAVLNFCIILFMSHFRDKERKRAVTAIKTMLLIMAATTFVLICSSYYRMGLYEQQYGYTYLRVFVYFCLFLGAVLLGLTCIYIFKEKFPLVQSCIITILIFYTGLNYANIDRIIASRNIDRYFETEKIDMNYLKVLSYDAVPEITRLLDAKEPEVAGETREYLQKCYNRLQQTDSWQEYNLSKYKAKDILLKLNIE